MRDDIVVCLYPSWLRLWRLSMRLYRAVRMTGPQVAGDRSEFVLWKIRDNKLAAIATMLTSIIRDIEI